MNWFENAIKHWCCDHYPSVVHVDGGALHYLADGIVALMPADNVSSEAAIFSAGIHGDETAPVELLHQLLLAIKQGKHPIHRPTLLILGNLSALARQTRQVDDNLNRVFSYPLSKNGNQEHQRAWAVAQSIEQFQQLIGTNCSLALHLDLHCFIYPDELNFLQNDQRHFGICLAEQPLNKNHQSLLQQLAITTVIADVAMPGTLSQYLINQYGLTSMALELGHAKAFGANHLQKLAQIEQFIGNQIAGQITNPVSQTLASYRFVPPLIKRHRSFRFNLDLPLYNFSHYQVGDVLAFEQDLPCYIVDNPQRSILFPWPSRPVGSPGCYLLERNPIALALQPPRSQ